MADKINQTSARQGTNKPPLTTILLAGLGLCLLIGVFLFFFAAGDQPEGEEVGGAVEELAPSELPEEEPKVDPSIDQPIIEPTVQ